jgi:hypothetical protein
VLRQAQQVKADVWMHGVLCRKGSTGPNICSAAAAVQCRCLCDLMQLQSLHAQLGRPFCYRDHLRHMMGLQERADHRMGHVALATAVWHSSTDILPGPGVPEVALQRSRQPAGLQTLCNAIKPGSCSWHFGHAMGCVQGAGLSFARFCTGGCHATTPGGRLMRLIY